MNFYSEEGGALLNYVKIVESLLFSWSWSRPKKTEPVNKQTGSATLVELRNAKLFLTKQKLKTPVKNTFRRRGSFLERFCLKLSKSWSSITSF